MSCLSCAIQISWWERMTWQPWATCMSLQSSTTSKSGSSSRTTSTRTVVSVQATCSAPGKRWVRACPHRNTLRPQAGGCGMRKVQGLWIWSGWETSVCQQALGCKRGGFWGLVHCELPELMVHLCNSWWKCLVRWFEANFVCAWQSVQKKVGASKPLENSSVPERCNPTEKYP